MKSLLNRIVVASSVLFATSWTVMAHNSEWHIDFATTDVHDAGVEGALPAAVGATSRNGRPNELGVYYWADTRGIDITEETASAYVDVKAHLGIESLEELLIPQGGNEGLSITMRGRKVAVMTPNATLIVCSFEGEEGVIEFAERLGDPGLYHSPAGTHFGGSMQLSRLRWIDDSTIAATVTWTPGIGFGTQAAVAVLRRCEQNKWSTSQLIGQAGPQRMVQWGSSLAAVADDTLLIYSFGSSTTQPEASDWWPSWHTATKVDGKWVLSSPATTRPSFGDLRIEGALITSDKKLVWFARGFSGDNLGYGYLGVSADRRAPAITHSLPQHPVAAGIAWRLSQSVVVLDGDLYAVAEGSNKEFALLRGRPANAHNPASWEVVKMLDRPEIPAALIHANGGICAFYDTSDYQGRVWSAELLPIEIDDN